MKKTILIILSMFLAVNVMAQEFVVEFDDLGRVVLNEELRRRSENLRTAEDRITVVEEEVTPLARGGTETAMVSPLVDSSVYWDASEEGMAFEPGAPSSFTPDGLGCTTADYTCAGSCNELEGGSYTTYSDAMTTAYEKVWEFVAAVRRGDLKATVYAALDNTSDYNCKVYIDDAAETALFHLDYGGSGLAYRTVLATSNVFTVEVGEVISVWCAFASGSGTGTMAGVLFYTDNKTEGTLVQSCKIRELATFTKSSMFADEFNADSEPPWTVSSSGKGTSKYAIHGEDTEVRAYWNNAIGQHGLCSGGSGNFQNSTNVLCGAWDAAVRANKSCRAIIPAGTSYTSCDDYISDTSRDYPDNIRIRPFRGIGL